MTNTRTLSRPRDGKPALMEDIKQQARRLHKHVQNDHLLKVENKQDFNLNRALELVARSHGYDTWGQLNAHLKGSTTAKPLSAPTPTPAAADNAAEVAFDTAGDLSDTRMVFGHSETEIRDRVCWAYFQETEISEDLHRAVVRVIKALPDQYAHGYHDPMPRPPLKKAEMEVVTSIWDQWAPLRDGSERDDWEARNMVGDHFLLAPDEERARDSSYSVMQFPASENVPDAPPTWATLSDPKGADPRTVESRGNGEDRRRCNMDGYEACPHVAYVCSDDAEAGDIVSRLEHATRRDWHPLNPVEICRDSSRDDRSTKTILRSLAEHIGREVDFGSEPLDTLLMNYERTPQRACGLRAPLVVSLPWRPHDSRLPRLLPELRRNNIFAIVRILPGDFEDYELTRLAEVMKHCHWHALAPGMCIPPKSGFERVMNRERRSLLLKRDV